MGKFWKEFLSHSHAWVGQPRLPADGNPSSDVRCLTEASCVQGGDKRTQIRQDKADISVGYATHFRVKIAGVFYFLNSWEENKVRLHLEVD